MKLAADFVRSSGGIERTRVFTRIWLAMFGLWSWDDLPVLPPELMYLPKFVPLNIYDFGCWARQTVVALTVVSAHRPSHEIGFDDRRAQDRVGPAAAGAANTWPGRFQALDRALKVYERRPLKLLRQAALRRAERWILAATGGRRLLGRHPAALGVLPHGSAACRATPSTTPSSRPGSKVSTASPSRTSAVGGSRPASPRSGTRHWR